MSIRLFFFFLLFTSYANINYGMGWSDWALYTNYGTEFDSRSGATTIKVKNRKSFKNIKKWYFYKSHIIGAVDQWRDGIKYDAEFIVINEKSKEFHVFKEKEKWINYIKTNKLRPKIWTRWFQTEWDHIRVIYLFAVLFIPMNLIVVIVHMVFLYKLIKAKGSRKKWATITFFLPIIILILYFLGKNPQSI